jgi:hypothetical protein
MYVYIFIYTFILSTPTEPCAPVLASPLSTVGNEEDRAYSKVVTGAFCIFLSIIVVVVSISKTLSDDDNDDDDYLNRI